MASPPRSRWAALRAAQIFVALALVASFGALSACTDILGITDRHLSSSSTGAGAAGGGGSAGSAGTGGIGGNPTCMTDADCAGSPYGEKCDPASHHCVECLPGPADDCAFGLYCDVTKLCTIGCAEDTDCNPQQNSGPLICDQPSHQCKQCGPSKPCPPGSRCDETGTCTPGCVETPDCPTADWSCCNNQCKNVSKDVQNCGACEDPCVPSQSTNWLCLDGGCVFQSCTDGYDDCDKNFAKGNGCEVNTNSDPKNCGGCNNPCSLANAGSTCLNGQCAIGNCNGAFQNCDGKVLNGCEADTSKDDKNCGTCGHGCGADFPNASGMCVGGNCAFASCKPGYGDCDQDEANGCEVDTDTSVQHCGGCGNACSFANGAGDCENGVCTVTSCEPGFANCNADGSDGCEVSLDSDPLNCKTCGNICMFTNQAGVCDQGTCKPGPCKPGYADCDNDPINGCEVHTTNDKGNCGACGHLCAGNNGTASCVNSDCQINCNAGFGDCDGDDSNGCETDTKSTVEHCGNCSTVCSAQSGNTPYCFMSLCGQSSCAAGTANCNGNPQDGCETNITTAQNCGSCGHVCSSTNGMPSCNGSTCSIACNAGFGNCNNNVNDGCEQQLNTVDHCTACGVPCIRPHAFTSCGNGTCTIISCEIGWADCNGIASDGCEANLATDLSNCGSCTHACQSVNGNATCVNGSCSLTCNSGYGNCNGNAADGCETNTSGSSSNCGMCGHQCSFANAGALCNVGTCMLGSCNPGYSSCDNVEANGCEANLQNDEQHCGSCASVCASVNGTATCNNYMCSLTCNGGYGNCNGLASDGCETPLNSLNNCGACNNFCLASNATTTCAAGSCQIMACNPGFLNCDNMASNGCECGTMCSGTQCVGCGDGQCSNTENCSSCPTDCGSCMMSGSGGAGGAGGLGGAGGTIIMPSGAGGTIMPNGAGGTIIMPSGAGGTIIPTGAGGMGGAPTTGSGMGASSSSMSSGPTTTSISSGPTTTSISSGPTTTSISSGPTTGSGGMCVPPPLGVACPNSPNSCTMLGTIGCCYPQSPTLPYCTAPAGCSGGPSASYLCDGSNDCMGTEICCRPAAGGSYCTTAQACFGVVPSGTEICSVPAAFSCECAGNQECCAGDAMKGEHYGRCQPSNTPCLIIQP